MAVKLDGSTAYLDHAAKIVSGFPYSIMLWVSADATGTDQHWAGQSEPATTRLGRSFLGANGTSKYAQVGNPGNSVTAVQTNPPQPNATMRLAVAVLTSTTSRAFYYGSNTPGTDANPILDDTTSHSRFTVGALLFNSAAAQQFCNGSVAEAHVFNVALTATDVTNLLADSVKPEAITGWVDGWILKPSGAAGSAAPASFLSIGGTRTLTTVGTATVSSQAHPISRSSSSFSGALVLDNETVTGSFSTVPTGSFSGALVLDNDLVSGSFGSQAGFIVSQPLATNNGTLLASTSMNYVDVTNNTTRVRAVLFTTGSTNASAVLSYSDPAVATGTVYRVDFETVTGKRGMVVVTAT